MAAYFALLVLAALLSIPALPLQKGGDLELAAILRAASLACFAFAATALALGTWRIFRPASRWPGVVCALLFVEMLTAWWFTVRSVELVSLQSRTTSNLFFAAGRLAIYVWAVTEAVAYYARLRKQQALRLVSPVAARQILLWGAASLCLGVTAALVVVRTQFFGVAEESELGVGSVVALGFSMCGSVLIWWAFFPPRFLRAGDERVELSRSAID